MQKAEIMEDTIEDDKENDRLFGKYRDAVERIKFIEWAKEEINKRPERIIIVKVDDLINEMGEDFKDIKYNTLYQALRYILFYQSLRIRIGEHKEGDKVFVIGEKRPDEKLPRSYLELEKKYELKELNKKKIKNLKIDRGKDKVKKIEKEREKLQEEFDQEREILLAQIKELRNILNGNLEYEFLVEIFQFDWKTLAWKLIKRKGANTYDDLFQLIKNYHSSMDNRYRFEFTSVTEKKIKNNEDVNLVKSEIGSNTDNLNLICPRCGGKNINIFPTEEIIKTRAGTRTLKYRCKDCNEIFGDEDLRQ